MLHGGPSSLRFEAGSSDLASNVSVKDYYLHLQQSLPELPRYPISAKGIWSMIAYAAD
jgi:hypothetical protein